MLSEEIGTVHAALGNLAGKIGEEEWELVRLCRRNLLAVQSAAGEMEKLLPVEFLPKDRLEPPTHKDQ